MEEKRYLTEKVELWKHLDNHLNTLESTYMNAPMWIVTILGAMIALVSTNSETNSNFTFMLFYAMPIFSIMAMYYLTYQSRVVEILRGNLIVLEDEINTMIGSISFVWNKECVLNFYNGKSKQNIAFCSQKFTLLFAPVLILSICFFSFYSLFSNSDLLIQKILIIILLIWTLCTAVILAIDTLNNGKVSQIIKSNIERLKEDA
jgi:cell division protein FtsL